MDNTEHEMVYEKNGDMWRLVDSTSPTKPVNSQSSEEPDIFKSLLDVQLWSNGFAHFRKV